MVGMDRSRNKHLCILQRRYPTRARNTASASNVVLKDVSAAVLKARLNRIATAPGQATGGVNPSQIGLGAKILGTQRNFNNGSG